MTNAYIYIRFSTPKQEHGDSYERQMSDAQAYCERMGWNVVEVVSDLGRSAYKGDHLKGGSLGKFADRVYAGEIPAGSILVVEQLDRLSRQGHRAALRWMEDICERGIKIAVAQGSKLYDHDSLRFNMLDTVEILLKAKLANDESEHKSVRVTSSWKSKQAAAQNKVVMSAKCPGWLKMKPDRSGFDVIEKRADTVRLIYQMAADGYGLLSISRELNGDGHERWGGGVQGWTQPQILRLLESPAVEGDLIPGFYNSKREAGERVVGYFGHRIVDAEIVARARAGLASRRRTGGRRYNKHANLFAGVTVCSACSGRMTLSSGTVSGSKDKQFSYMVCTNARVGNGCDHRGFFKYRQFEEAALKQILHLALDDRFFQRPDETARFAVAAAEAEKRVSDVKERVDNLARNMAMVKDAGPLFPVYDQLTAELSKAKTAKEKADDALVRARGSVSPSEHLQRVLEVQSALSDPDDETRFAARLRVHEAMLGVVNQVICDTDELWNGVRQRIITLILVGGVQAFKFDYDGNLLASVDATRLLETVTYRDGDSAVTTNAIAARRGITGDEPRQEAMLDGLLRRKEASVAADK